VKVEIPCRICASASREKGKGGIWRLKVMLTGGPRLAVREGRGERRRPLGCCGLAQVREKAGPRGCKGGERRRGLGWGVMGDSAQVLKEREIAFKQLEI
jgi:hypothetical protein